MKDNKSNFTSVLKTKSMKRSTKHIIILLFVVFCGRNLYSSALTTTIWFKSGQEICLDNFIFGKNGIFNAGKEVEFEYKNIDSLFTLSKFIAEALAKQHNVLLIKEREGGYFVTGFGNIINNVININAEIGGRAIVAGLNVGFVYDGRHSFDLCYADAILCEKNIIVRELLSFNYSYLFGKQKYKLELGTGLSHGRVIYTKNCGSISEVIDTYKGFMVHGVLGVRYQSEKTGPFLKVGVSPVLYMESHIRVEFSYNIGFGYTFGIPFP